MMKRQMAVALCVLGIPMTTAFSEQVHMGFWDGRWNVVRKQQTDSVHAGFRAADSWIAHTTNLFEAVQTAYNALPAHPSGSATRNLVWVRNFTNTSHTISVTSLPADRRMLVLRNRHSVDLDFDGNTFVLNGGVGSFLDAASINGLAVKNLNLYMNPDHTGEHVIRMRMCDNAVVENFNCHRNNQGGIAVRMDGSPGVAWMSNATFRGGLSFSGGRWDKWAIETMTVNNLRMGHVNTWWGDGSAVCVNNGTNTNIDKVEGYRMCYKPDAAYGIVRFVNNTIGGNYVGEVAANECGRALASDTSPSLGLTVGRVVATNCREYGIMLQAGGRVVVQSGQIHGGCGKAGILVGGGTSADMTYMDVQNVDMTGVQISGTNCRLSGSYIKNSKSGFGIHVNGGSGTLIESTSVLESGNSGVRLQSCQSAEFRGSVANQGRRFGLEILSSASNSVIRNSSASGNASGSTNGSTSTSVIGSSIDWR